MNYKVGDQVGVKTGLILAFGVVGRVNENNTYYIIMPQANSKPDVKPEELINLTNYPELTEGTIWLKIAERLSEGGLAADVKRDEQAIRGTNFLAQNSSEILDILYEHGE